MARISTVLVSLCMLCSYSVNRVKFLLVFLFCLIGAREVVAQSDSVRYESALSNMDGVECSITIDPKRPRQGERFEVVLTCNRKPDSARPTVTLNGQVMESGGYHYSAINSDETYKFIYVAREGAESGNYTLSVKELAFGGTSYPLPDAELEVTGGRTHSPTGGDTPSIWVWLVIAGVYMLLVYLGLWLRFRKEVTQTMAEFVLKYRRLNLNTSCAYTHYGFPLTILIIPFIFVGVSLYEYAAGVEMSLSVLFWFGALPLLLAYISYRRQRAKLYFEPIATTLTMEQIQQIVVEIANRNNWILDHVGEDCIAAHTIRRFPSLSWGEQVFVVFDKDRVWINSVNDLNKKSVACSFGYPKRNIRLLKEVIK